MRAWTHALESYSPEQVREYCVKDTNWQRCRLSMKGVRTEKKLDICWAWLNRETIAGGTISLRTKIQVSNYINALKRGGQLHVDGTIKREL